jgi:hypothetical protein
VFQCAALRSLTIERNLPFELRVLEGALHGLVQEIGAEISELVDTSVPAMDALIKHVSRHELEIMRHVKNNVEALLTRTQRIRKACAASFLRVCGLCLHACVAHAQGAAPLCCVAPLHACVAHPQGARPVLCHSCLHAWRIRQACARGPLVSVCVAPACMHACMHVQVLPHAGIFLVAFTSMRCASLATAACATLDSDDNCI